MRRLMNQVQKYERHEISFYRGLEYNYGANWSTVLLCILYCRNGHVARLVGCLC